MVGLVGTHPVRETTDGLEISFGCDKFAIL